MGTKKKNFAIGKGEIEKKKYDTLKMFMIF